jgi:hypothetical protein
MLCSRCVWSRHRQTLAILPSYWSRAVWDRALQPCELGLRRVVYFPLYQCELNPIEPIWAQIKGPLCDSELCLPLSVTRSWFFLSTHILNTVVKHRDRFVVTIHKRMLGSVGSWGEVVQSWLLGYSQYNPEDSSEHHTRRRENLKSHIAEEKSRVRNATLIGCWLTGEWHVDPNTVITHSENIILSDILNICKFFC